MTVFGLVLIAWFAYLDWILHREAAFVIIFGLVAAGVVVWKREIIDRLNLGPNLAQVPVQLKPVIAAVPGIAYFLARGQGTSGAGGVVLVSMLLVIGAGAFLGPAIDVRLRPVYDARNRILPLPVRMALGIIVPVLLSFLLIHGSLSDLPALFGGTTKTARSPAGLEGRFLLATLLSAAVGWLLLRQAPPEPAAAGVSAISGGHGEPAADSSAWAPTHVVPASGMPAWGAPDPATPVIADLDPGLPLRVVERAGDWSRVTAANGWMGWVDGRVLEETSG
jgi:hypothetical protein